MDTRALANTIRGKKLGVLLRNARVSRHKNLEECAYAIGTTPEMMQAYELGERSPSLPEIELLAYFLGLTIEHFWNQTGLLNPNEVKRPFDPKQLVNIRQRVVGVLLRKARAQTLLSLEELAAKTGILVENLAAYEMGEPIPLPDLESLAQVLNVSVKEFQDTSGPVGGWFVQQRVVQSFEQLPLELQDFVAKPVNRPYLELAQRLSEMDAEKLRGVAESLLEITL
jgi:transcriptional regulator with XRE-family HTH domain